MPSADSPKFSFEIFDNEIANKVVTAQPLVSYPKSGNRARFNSQQTNISSSNCEYLQKMSHRTSNAPLKKSDSESDKEELFDIPEQEIKKSNMADSLIVKSLMVEPVATNSLMVPKAELKKRVSFSSHVELLVVNDKSRKFRDKERMIVPMNTDSNDKNEEPKTEKSKFSKP